MAVRPQAATHIMEIMEVDSLISKIYGLSSYMAKRQIFEFNWVSGLWVAAFILKTGFVLRGTNLMDLEIVLNGRVLGLGCDWAFSSGRLLWAFSLVMEACGHDYGRCKAMMMNKMA